MKLWVEPWRVPPPHNETLSAKYGAMLCWVGYSKWRDEWVMLANGREEKIAPPPLWLCSAEYYAAHVIKDAVPPAKLDKPTVRIRRSKKPAQLGLGLK